MNPYQNNDEIVDIPENYDNNLNRYPYANDPNVAMQNTNYKDWMNGYEEINPSSITAILASIGILNRVIALTGVLGNTQEVISIIQDALGFIRNGTGNELLIHVEQLIQQTLATQYRSAATGAIYGISRSYDNYLMFFRQWERNRTRENGQQVESAFTTINTLCINALAPQALLSRRGFETLLLPNYAMAANFHLLLLRDAVLYRTQWLSNSISTANANLNILRAAINEYSTHCKRWYQDGLNRFDRSSRANMNEWRRFNAYRRDMTLSVLDFATVFPTYDPIRFPTATNVELTRVVYTDPIVMAGGRTAIPGFTRMENLANSASRVSFLNQMNIYTSFYFRPHNIPRYYWAGNRNFLSNGNSNFYGYNSDRRIVFNVSNMDIFRVNMTTHIGGAGTDDYRGLHRADFIGANTQNNQRTSLLYSVEIPSSHFRFENHTVFLPGESGLEPNERNYTHRLFQMMNEVSVNPNARGAVFLHAWTHRSLRRTNGLRSDQIMQIPAVKTISNGGDRAVVLNYGENIMKLDNLTTGLSYKLTAVDSEASNTRFIVRVRYASMNNNKLNLVLNGAQIASLNVEHTVQSGGSLTDLQYGNFKYATFAGNFKMGSQSILGIFKEIPDAEFVLDKIELIPAHFISSLEQTQDYNTYNQDTIYTHNQGYDTYDQNSSGMYHQSYNNYDQNMDTTYQPRYDNYNQNFSGTYDDGYNPNTSDSYDQSYTNNYSQNTNSMYDQGSYNND
ncbi:pesticidal crystal protein cry20Aa [Bacillus cereus HuB4-4]|uniref:Crystaline entomocidal protoxin n=1 Tax=Bacillus cereus HuB4-4 TaxID=1053211 RepID=A0A9W5VMC3_BACCE|nr:insecticidal delta-endotoxin Cry8Ea1 family protein [Bacillus cereus]EOP90060.1 pesticidal crystal protein cry20Aa [Bacillus cereus HuB4-4]